MMKLTYFDRINDRDELIGGTASYDEVHGKGLWHRGVHIIIYTPDKKIVMQKRSPSLKYHPSEIEVTVGGGVDAGETPRHAIIREVSEELGIHLNKDDLHFIGKTKSNHHTRSQTNRVFIYSYSICIPEVALKMHIDIGETSLAFLVPERELRRALKVHRIKNIGRISSLYAYWTYLLDSI
jgi:isopentenyl-diphosphate delta-isomerase